mmetsp:Transcript_23594/g.65487  ORF Transcript_23594/g.65487 Transcript_23594/m.65487 type:complete len:508 (-) Transcript_23594:302-1825(-)|eukprot:CAMPEP_0172365610 /NCGR_PEP_ID=MMETSP1060-20121228/10545_1 /TAXON_ID=37318 /ORGANISM="Pseudo-nitzschia pungens, Strain cf. cingulata" /LENGTH=507 /DNA_ID=CAMNT_0013088983 /DNA_START=89 /DNA_END=1612 /DNA_ORIENTATION=-
MTDFATMRVWSSEEATSSNPICLDDIAEDQIYEATPQKKSSSGKKKKRRRRKKFTDEESTVADSVLSSILSESEGVSDDDTNIDKFAEKNLMTLDEDTPSPQVDFYGNGTTRTMVDPFDTEKHHRKERLDQIKARRIQRKIQREQMYPSSDEEDGNKDNFRKNPFSKEDKAADDTNDLSKNPFSDKNQTNAVDHGDGLGKNPFSDRKHTNSMDDDDLSKNPFSDKNEINGIDYDDDLSKNPFSDKNETNGVDDDDLSKNPFLDKNFKNNKTIANDDLSKNPFSDENDAAVSDESSTIRPPPQSIYREQGGTNPFDNVSDEVKSDEDDDATEETTSDKDDIIESSRRLLRCVDQRIQYQQQNDEVASLKSEIEQMKAQAEAMAEQLRRAVETKCDLVLAQNEMERRHEQEMIGKDGEVRDLRLYIQDILEQQAQSELNFMNEISSLARTVEADKARHKEQLEEKESRIFQLETRVESMRVASVRSSSKSAYRSRYSEAVVKELMPTFE